MRYLALFLLMAALGVAQPQHRNPAPRAPRPAPRVEHNTGRSSRHTGQQSAAYRHWQGSRFDDRFYRRHFGREHPVIFEWIGIPCLYGSQFWFGGVTFEVIGYPTACFGMDWFIVWDEDTYSYVLISSEAPQRYIIRVVW